jgi:hypothetical protein
LAEESNSANPIEDTKQSGSMMRAEFAIGSPENSYMTSLGAGFPL